MCSPWQDMKYSDPRPGTAPTTCETGVSGNVSLNQLETSSCQRSPGGTPTPSETEPPITPVFIGSPRWAFLSTSRNRFPVPVNALDSLRFSTPYSLQRAGLDAHIPQGSAIDMTSGAAGAAVGNSS